MVHGHNITELERLLQDSCTLFDGDVSLENEALGGWENINIHGHYDRIDFVLKLPCSISSQEADPYKHLYDISRFFAKLGITAMPLSMGRLSDKMNTPFIIFDYIHGMVYDSHLDFSGQDIRHLKDCLQILYNQKPPGLRRYKSPSDFLIVTHSLVENHEGLSSCSQEVGLLIDSFNEFYSEVQSYSDSLGTWSSTLMHGDLWAPNIIMQTEKAILLDFEACAYGNQFYDLAFLLETPSSPSIDTITGLLGPDEESVVTNLRPIALAYIIDWSLERLLSMDSGLVEPNLNTAENRSAVIGFTRSKISRLNAILS